LWPLVVSLCVGALEANAQPFQFLPMPGVYMPDRGEPSLAEAAFLDSVTANERGRLRAASIARLPAAVTELTEANRRRTLTVSALLSRASLYTVPNPSGTVHVFLPVTASVYLIDVATGETLFARTRTTIQAGSYAADDATVRGAAVQDSFRTGYSATVDDLVDDIRRDFTAAPVTATVRGRWHSHWLLDGGTNQGFVRDDTLFDGGGNEMTLVWTGPHHSVGRVVLGVAAPGSRFTKPLARTLAECARPRILPIIATAPPDVPREAVVQLFADQLGAKAPISLVPVNPTYARVLATIATKVDVSQEGLRQRALPDWFARLHILDPTQYTTPTNVAHKSLFVTESLVALQITDRMGQVVVNALGSDRIEDEVVGEVAFTPAARREIGMKNALLDLARNVSGRLRPQRVMLSIVRSDEGELAVDDPAGVLALGQALTVVRPVAGVSGLPGPVHVPVAETSVSAVRDNQAVIAESLAIEPQAAPVVPGDLLVVDLLAATSPNRKRFIPCGGDARLGTYDLPDFAVLAENLLPTGLSARYLVPAVQTEVAQLVRSGSGFRGSLPSSSVAVDECLQPVYKIDPAAPPQCEDGICSQVFDVAVGVRIRSVGAAQDVPPRAKTALKTRLTVRALPSSAGDEARRQAARADIRKEVAKLLPQVATDLNAAIGGQRP
jgi:hypothetical protein